MQHIVKKKTMKQCRKIPGYHQNQGIVTLFVIGYCGHRWCLDVSPLLPHPYDQSLIPYNRIHCNAKPLHWSHNDKGLSNI